MPLICESMLDHKQNCNFAFASPSAVQLTSKQVDSRCSGENDEPRPGFFASFALISHASLCFLTFCRWRQ